MSEFIEPYAEIAPLDIYESDLIAVGSQVSVQTIDGPHDSVTLREWMATGVVIEERSPRVTNRHDLVFLPFHRITSIVRDA